MAFDYILEAQRKYEPFRTTLDNWMQLPDITSATELLVKSLATLQDPGHLVTSRRVSSICALACSCLATDGDFGSKTRTQHFSQLWLPLAPQRVVSVSRTSLVVGLPMVLHGSLFTTCLVEPCTPLHILLLALLSAGVPARCAYSHKHCAVIMGLVVPDVLLIRAYVKDSEVARHNS